MKYIHIIGFFLIMITLFAGCSGDNNGDLTANSTDGMTTTEKTDDEVIITYNTKVLLKNPKEYVQTEGDIHFSIDYPPDYSYFRSSIDDGWIHVSFTTDNVSNYVYAVDGVSGIDYHASDIFLSVYKIGSLGYYTIQDIHERFFDFVNENWEDKIIQDTEWGYNDISGYQFVYLNWNGPIIMKPERTGVSLEEILEPMGFVRVITQYIAFESHGYFWWFTFSTPVESYEDQDEILEQVIESLTILD